MAGRGRGGGQVEAWIYFALLIGIFFYNDLFELKLKVPVQEFLTIRKISVFAMIKAVSNRDICFIKAVLLW